MGIFATVLLVYWPALSGTFIWDDDGHVTRPELRSLAGLGRIWFELGATQQYYPVLHSAFWLEQFAFGDAPAGYHLLNVLLHATAACLFAQVLRRLNVAGAWFAALLFALHPVCVESVAWISEQKNTLSTVLYLLAALAYLRFDRERRGRDYGWATFFFFLAVGTKTVSGTLPAALLVIFWWQRGRVELRRDVAPLAPWFALAGVAGGLTAWVEHTLVGAAHNEFAFDLVQRGLLASRVIWFYLGKLVLPVDLMFVYPRWNVDASQAWQYIFPAGLLLLAFVAWRGRADRGPVAAGLIFAGSLFPALGFVNVFPFVYSFVADHFQYLASLAVFALAGAGWARSFARRRRWEAPAFSVGVLAVLAVLTWRQSATYRDVFTLYENTLEKNPEAWMPHNNLGNALVRAGRVEEAMPHFEAALRLRPKSAEIENNFGFALLSLRQPAAALPHFERALRLWPEYVFAGNNLGLALIELERAGEAEEALRRTLGLKPGYPEAHFNLGRALRAQNKTAEAAGHFAEAARLRPGNVETELNLAIALALAQRSAEAFPHFERAVRLAPKRADIRNIYGSALQLDGRLDEAIAQFRDALELSPRSAEIHANLGEALRKAGRNDEAARQFTEAARLGGRN